MGRGRRPFSLHLRRLRNLRSRWRRRWCIDVDNFWTLVICLFHVEGQIDLRWLRRVNRDRCRRWKGQRRRWWRNDDGMLAHLLRYRRRRRLHRWWSRLGCRLRRLRFRRLLKHFIHKAEQIFIFFPFFFFLRILRLLLRFLLLFLFLFFGLQSTLFANLIDSNFSASSPFGKVNVLARFQIALCAFQDILKGLIVKALSQHVIDIIFVCLAI